MPTPKPYIVLAKENKSHRTKAELNDRKRAEKEAFSGQKLKKTQRVRDNVIANNEFKRVSELLKAIDKNDDLFSGPMNRYCELVAEIADFEKRIDTAKQAVDNFIEKEDEYLEEEGNTIKSHYQTLVKLEGHVIALDKAIQAKRKMMFDIEKENLMTVAAAMRSVVTKPKEKKSALEEALGD